MKIIQIVEGYKAGDGVSNIAYALDQLIRTMGYETEIYDHTIVGIEESIRDKEIFIEENIVLYHLAFTFDPKIASIPCKKVLVFHNITNPDLFLNTDELSRIYCSSGLYYTSFTSQYFNLSITFSEYSKRTLISHKWHPEKIIVLPALVELKEFGNKIDHSLQAVYKKKYTNILFAGRMAPHKKIEDVISAFAEYHKKYNRASRLFLVGNISNDNYFPSLKRYITELDVEDAVIFTGKVSQESYETYFNMASLFLCMSEHEGFCIPLVEAMMVNVPIVAYEATAVPDTLNGAGITIKIKDNGKVAEIINRILTDEKYRNEILQKQKLRLKELYSEDIVDTYKKVINKVIYDVSDMSTLFFNNDNNRFRLISMEEYGLSKIEKTIADNIVLYGFGSFGKFLYEKFKDSNYANVVSICDAGKGGKGERIDRIEIITPDIAVKSYPDSLYIVTIQDIEIALGVIMRLHTLGISKDKIMLFNKERGLIRIK